MERSLWLRSILGLATLQLVAGLAGFVCLLLGLAEPEPAQIPAWTSALQGAAAGGAGLWLLLVGARDPRTLAFAGVLLLVASSFAHRLIPPLAAAAGPLGPAFVALRHLPADAFLPLLIWRFFADFPHAITSRRGRRWVRFAERFSALAGCGLFAVTALRGVPGLELPGWLGAFDRFRITSHYWTVTYGLALPALPLAVLRSRFARPAERRRVALFLLGIALAGVPAALYILVLALFPAFLPWARRTGVNAVLVPALELAILSVPIATAYAVGALRLLPVNTLLRRALGYALARGVLLAAIAVPFAAAAAVLLRSRDLTLGELLSGPRLVVLAGALALGALALRVRERGQDLVDRRFFREQYDARRVLASLIARCREVRWPGELGALLAGEIERALHLDVVGFFARGPDGCLAATGLPTLPAASPLATWLASVARPLDVDLEHPEPELAELPLEDRQWLADGGFRLLVPMVGAAGDLLGAIALGAKKSELPFSREDRDLLADVAQAGALALENRWSPAGAAAADSTDEERAQVCAACGRVAPDPARACQACAGALEAAPIPAVLLGKFRLEQRLGAGAMGVVYRAEDLGLGRRVALKTLPQVSPEAAVRLRREARAMASVVHPHLALIFGVEAWRGTPLLVIEYLDGGTLASRVGPDRRLSPAETIALGIALAEALDATHRAGILHRDVKPSNIGFTGAGVAKLLDFGVARIVTGALQPAREPATGGAPRPHDGRGTGSEWVLGTPLYLSPEALRGDTADASFDLWSLAVVLYEASAGRHPFERASWPETMAAIAHAAAPDLRSVCADAPPALAELFADALALEPRRRPSSARELAQRLERVRSAAAA